MTSCSVDFGQKQGYAEIVVKSKVLGIEVNAIYGFFLVSFSFYKNFPQKMQVEQDYQTASSDLFFFNWKNHQSILFS